MKIGNWLDMPGCDVTVRTFSATDNKPVVALYYDGGSSTFSHIMRPEQARAMGEKLIELATLPEEATA